MGRQYVSDDMGHVLGQARDHVEHTRHTLHTGGLDPQAAHAVVEGVHHVASAVAGLVGALMEQLTTFAAEHDADRALAAREVVADLRAMYGCLTTGVLLLDPALEDLRGLAAPAVHNPTHDTPTAETAWMDEPTRGEVEGTTTSEDATQGHAMGASDVSVEAGPAEVPQQRTGSTEDPFRD